MRTLAISVFCLFFGACDSVEEGAGLGAFEATFTGDLSTSLTGDAAFSRSADPTGAGGVSITMIPDGGLGLQSLGVVDTQATLDGEGTYSLDIDGERALGLVYFDSGAGLQLFATSGSVRVTRFEADRIEGAFEATMREGFVEGEGRTARVEGTFSARPLPVRS